ncbi:MAG TPA: winged helix-turn-helix domain-containing protein [Inquilinus sp.]|nr:winged helix-turn-helix domain-containing protein [Inquilinus sp.]
MEAISKEFVAKRHVLVVDQESETRGAISSFLRDGGGMTVTVSDPHEVRHRSSGQPPSLIILVLQPGNGDEFARLRAIRAHCDVPVILVSDDLGGEVHRVAGLDLGADDYVAKPVVLRELLARIRTILRRRDLGAPASPVEIKRRGFRFGGWHLDCRERRLSDQTGAEVELTRGEYALLVALLENPQLPLSREFLLQATRKHEDVTDRAIDVTVTRLRRKLEGDGSLLKPIRAERGVGYIFALGVEAF